MTGVREGDVTARLREAITNGRFMPSERLIEAELATILSANRATVRMALARLEQEGLVVSEPNRGARVRVVSEAEAAEILQVRGVLEGLVARQAAQRATDVDRGKLRTFVDQMRAALEASNLIEYSQTNGRLHAELQRIAGHETAARLLATLKSQIVRFQYRGILVPGRAAKSLAEHEAIVEAVCASDPDAAERAMHEHLAEMASAASRFREISTMALP